MASTRTHASSFSFWSAVTRRRHDVFLSFRGEDTRHNITQQLHRALGEAGVPTFKDDVNLEKGGEIASELLKAIQMSRIAIIIFSRNYATSGWCLDELLKIIECKNEAGLVVLPVFYDVDPCDVGQQTGLFAEAFRMHEERFRLENPQLGKDKVDKWTAALTEAASLSPGWDMQNVSSWHQSKFIKEIVKHLISRHQDAHMSVSIFPPRMNTSKEYLNLLLSVISDDVLIIGICGMDKTSVARAVYSQNFQRFEGSSFLPNVSIIGDRPDGLVALQKRFLSDILREEDDLKIDNVERGIDVIKSVVCNKRILLVLDNVNNLDQLNALARKRDWFGSGSRIIVTTKDGQLLNVLEVDDVYGAEGIQVIEDKFRQNLQMIEDLIKSINRSHSQAHETEKSLIAEIEREQKKSITQARIIANLLPSPNEGISSNKITTDIIMNGIGAESCECGNLEKAMFDFKPEKEFISGNAFGGDEGEVSMRLHIETKDMMIQGRSDEGAWR